MTRSRETLLNQLDAVSCHLDALSRQVEQIVKELDPQRERRRDMAALKSARAWPGQEPQEIMGSVCPFCGGQSQSGSYDKCGRCSVQPSLPEDNEHPPFAR